MNFLIPITIREEHKSAINKYLTVCYNKMYEKYLKVNVDTL